MKSDESSLYVLQWQRNKIVAEIQHILYSAYYGAYPSFFVDVLIQYGESIGHFLRGNGRFLDLDRI